MQNSVLAANNVESPSVALLVGNEVLCRGLEAVLRSLSTVGAVHRYTAPEDAAFALRADRVDFLIAAVEDLERLEEEHGSPAGRDTKILVLVDTSSMTDPSAYTSASADGYLSQQDLSSDTLSEALRRCALGELPMPPVLARVLIARSDAPVQHHRTRPISLTARESEALELLVRGLSNKQIARRLSISSHGAKRLVASIMLKLDSPNRTAAVVNAIKAGIIQHL